MMILQEVWGLAFSFAEGLASWCVFDLRSGNGWISWGDGGWALLESEVVFGTRLEERRDVRLMDGVLFLLLCYHIVHVFSYCIDLSHCGMCG